MSANPKGDGSVIGMGSNKRRRLASVRKVRSNCARDWKRVVSIVVSLRGRLEGGGVRLRVRFGEGGVSNSKRSAIRTTFWQGSVVVYPMICCEPSDGTCRT